LTFPGFYPIVDIAVCRTHGLDASAVASACFQAGAKLLQLRHKEGSSGEFADVAGQVAVAAREQGAALIVNDRADVCRIAAAAGVHVGQDDLPVDVVRRIAGADAIVGLSTHVETQVDAALPQDVDYVAVGPVFATTTKATGYEERGLELVRYAAGRGKPIVAIGGITIGRVPLLAAAGASSVAVISDLLRGGDPGARTREYLEAVARGGAGRPH
jgi:thiamine-phosphate pyrophosphorylase